MKRLSLLSALLCAALFAFADPVEEYDVNFALASNGSSATASSGNAAEAIDGNTGTRWESAQTDDETWVLNMGQLRIFNTVKIMWEGAYAKEYELTYSSDSTNWSSLYKEENLTQAGWQTIELQDKVTAQYIKYHGTKRATQWGQSFYEFQVFLPGVSTLTKIELSAAAGIAKVGEGVALNVVAKDQNDKAMDVEIAYEITPEDAGSVQEGKFIPAKFGAASIVAKSGEVKSAAVEIFGYEGDNVALEKDVEASGYDEVNNLFPRFAVDNNDGSLWSAVAGETGNERVYDAWIIVDLGNYYDVGMIAIRWEGACSKSYHVDFSADKADWRTAINAGWNAIATHWEYLYNFVESAAKVRYVRVWSTEAVSQYGIKIMDLKVFATPYVPKDDNEKPVMVSAELVSKTWNAAVIAVNATDNDIVARYHVTDAAKSIDAKYVADEGKITVTGLTATTEYNFVVTAIDLAENESENSKTVAVTTEEHYTAPVAAAPAPTWPASQVKVIYSPTYNTDCGFGEWGSGTQVSDTDFGKKYVLSGGGYFGMVDFSLNCLNMEKLHFDIWIEDNAQIRVVPIWGGAEQGVFVQLVGGQWNSIDIDMTQYNTITDWSNIFQVKIDEAHNLTFWIANAYFYRTTPLEDNETPTDFTASLASTSFFSVTIAASADDNMGAVNYVVKNGDEVVATGAGAAKSTVNIIVPNLQSDTEYNLSVTAMDEVENATEPIIVTAKTLAAPASAPVPDFTGKEAVSVFCDALENNPAITIGNWSQTTVAQVVELAEGDNVFFGTNFNYLGWELAPSVNASGMEYIHADFYAVEVNTVQLTPISPGKEGIFTANLKAGEWTSVDVPLSAYATANIVWSNIFQFKFMEAQPAGKDLFIDNVYFYKTATGIENTVNVSPASKFMQNGTLYIMREGVTYTIQGTRVH